jgi:hypothetical protein
MRQLRVIVLELFVAPLFLWWLYEEIPDDAFDALLPWILAAVAWHLFYECIWESPGVKAWRKRSFTSRVRHWTFFALTSAVLYSLLWFVARGTIDTLTALHRHGRTGPGTISRLVPDAWQRSQAGIAARRCRM